MNGTKILPIFPDYLEFRAPQLNIVKTPFGEPIRFFCDTFCRDSPQKADPHL